MTHTIRVLAGVAAALTCALLTSALTNVAATHASSSAALANPRPNLWVVMLDDATVGDANRMPVVRWLADRGVRFTRAYSSAATCCPARASLLTGDYPHNTGVLTNFAPDGGFFAFDDDVTLATRLDPAYATGWIGKYLNDYEKARDTYVPPGWDFWRAPVQNVYHYLDRLLSINGRVVWRKGTESTTLTGELTRTFMQRQVSRPFFLVSSFLAPHNGPPEDPDDVQPYPTPHVPPRLRNTYRGPSPRQDPGFNEAVISDKRAAFQATPRLGAQRIHDIVEANAQRRESLRLVNLELRSTLRTLRRTNELQHTVIVFMSDNGFMLGQHRIPGRKSVTYEPASRIPLLVSGPGWPRDTVIGAPVGLHDLAPTLLRDARVWQPAWQADTDGVDLSAVVADPEQWRERSVLLEMGDNHGGYRYQGVVGSRWKLTRYFKPGVQEEMYDLQNDPHELVSLARDPSWDPIQLALGRRLDLLSDCSGVGCSGLP